MLWISKPLLDILVVSRNLRIDDVNLLVDACNNADLPLVFCNNQTVLLENLSLSLWSDYKRR